MKILNDSMNTLKDTTGSTELSGACYQPEIWEVRKDYIYAAITSIRYGLEYATECLHEHDEHLGRTIRKNKLWAEIMEKDIAQMSLSLEWLRSLTNNQVEAQHPHALFAPFDDDGILCVQNGKITTEPDEYQDWTEYHLEKFHGEVWRIERSDAAELCSFVYQGLIPNRAFFVSIMNNQETPLPNGWDNN